MAELLEAWRWNNGRNQGDSTWRTLVLVAEVQLRGRASCGAKVLGLWNSRRETGLGLQNWDWASSGTLGWKALSKHVRNADRHWDSPSSFSGTLNLWIQVKSNSLFSTYPRPADNVTLRSLTQNRCVIDLVVKHHLKLPGLNPHDGKWTSSGQIQGEPTWKCLTWRLARPVAWPWIQVFPILAPFEPNVFCMLEKTCVWRY
jgi:hypothetical protein